MKNSKGELKGTVEKSSKIFIAGRSGQVGSAIERRFRKEGFENIIGLRSKELELRNQRLVEYTLRRKS